MATSADIIFTLLGALGACLVLLGFYRISVGRWTKKSLWYELDNVLGPLLLIVYAAYFGAYVTIVVNAIWMIVAFRGLIPFAERYGRKLRTQAARRARERRRVRP